MFHGLYEKYLPEHLDPLQLTLLHRNQKTLEGKIEYLAALDDTMPRIKRVLAQPLFQWDGHTSPSFRFEKARLLQSIVDQACREADAMSGEGDYVEAKKRLDVAILHAKLALQNGDWVLRPRIHQLHPNFLLAQVHHTTSKKYLAMFKFKPLVKAITRSFQHAELAARLWDGQFKPLLALWHQRKAQEDDDFQEAFSHIHRARELADSEAIRQDYETFQTRNEVHHCEPGPVDAPPLLSVKETAD